MYTAPSVKPGYFLYFDPVDLLDSEVQERWKDPEERERMIRGAIAAAEAAPSQRVPERVS